MTDDRTREELIAEAEKLEAEAKSLLNGEIELEESDEDYLSNNEPMESAAAEKYAGYPPPPPPSDKRTIHLANNSGRRCTAHRKNGEQCRKWAIQGSNICKSHGGAAPQVVAKAKQRLQEASARLSERLIGLAENSLADGTKVGAYVQVQAINSALDRAGVSEQKQLDVSVSTPLDQILTDLVSGSRADYRRSIGHPDPEPQSLAIEPSNTTSPGGPRQRGDHLVIDAELVEANSEAGGGQGEPDDQGEHAHRLPGYLDGRQTLTNPVLPPNLPNGGYLPAEDALEQAHAANVAHLVKLRRR